MSIPDENEAAGNDAVAPDESSVSPAADMPQDDPETDAAQDDLSAAPTVDFSSDDSESDDGIDEPDDAQHLPRWQRIVQHRAFKPTVTILGGVAYLGFSIWRAVSSGEADEVVDSTDEFQETDDDSDCHESRNSPIQHSVGGYTRIQHYGPGNEETKTVDIEPYTRGVAIYDEDDDDYDETLSLFDAADYWMSSGKDEDYTFCYSQEELEEALGS